ncbi:Aste57867_15455 [Aphanomyces stellatus]|uniref:Aste57867_15455 protein n=1 Tax=Aphanomyces stellatus TaxID=120398 RepID=A0A485L361_9STRA|nr:hypothetical protein As57867_015399 [Aphanomyces stellatus]VFT92257.1 Aste57867_15455 [Aphanomyces stellatus]
MMMMLSRATAAARALPQATAAVRSFHGTSLLSARKGKSTSRLTIKRSVRDTQDAMKKFDMSSFIDDDEDDDEVPARGVKMTKMKEAMRQMNDPDTFEFDKVPLAKRGVSDETMTEEELEALFDEDDDDDDEDEEEFDRELERLEAEDDKKRVKKMFTTGRAIQALQSNDLNDRPLRQKKATAAKNAVPLHKDEKESRFNPEIIDHRQQRVGLMLEDFIQAMIEQETDLCRGNIQVWISHVDVSPDLRHAKLCWDINTLDHSKVSKTAERRVIQRLDKMVNWLRVKVTQNLQLKVRHVIDCAVHENIMVDSAIILVVGGTTYYTPKLTFERHDNTSMERRKKFDEIMAGYGY